MTHTKKNPTIMKTEKPELKRQLAAAYCWQKAAQHPKTRFEIFIYYLHNNSVPNRQQETIAHQAPHIFFPKVGVLG